MVAHRTLMEKLHAQIVALLNAASDETHLQAIDMHTAWYSDNEYAVSDVVRHDGKLYRCLTAHTSQAAWTPDAAPSLWARILIPDPEVIPEWEQPESTNGYMTGDKVLHNGQTWVSAVDNNVWEPGVYGWKEESVE